MTTTTELIAEARERFEDAKAAHGDSSLAVQKMLLVAGFVPRLADALEAATSRPPMTEPTDAMNDEARRALHKKHGWIIPPTHMHTALSAALAVQGAAPEWLCANCKHPWPAGDGNPNMGKYDRCSICGNDEWVPVSEGGETDG